MTKKHFKAFATEIRQLLDGGSITRETAQRMARMVASVAIVDNGRFDSQRFFAAAGVPELNG
jgi:hypothetical protein